MPNRILGETVVIQKLRENIRRAAKTNARVLILGENGTGKELVAEALHACSERSNGPLVAVNCAAIPEQLLESELFGHEKGSFTGAHEKRVGKFEQAAGGTLFLDEIGDMPILMQTKLLRVLQHGSYQRVGGKQVIQTDVRIISATNRNLRAEIPRLFREDLYHRLTGLVIRSPALREHVNDVPLLAAEFIRVRTDVVLSIHSGAVRELKSYSYPGNVRELENIVERILYLCDGPEIITEHVCEAINMDKIDNVRSIEVDISRAEHEPAEASKIQKPGDVVTYKGKKGIVVAIATLDGLPKFPLEIEEWPDDGRQTNGKELTYETTKTF